MDGFGMLIAGGTEEDGSGDDSSSVCPGNRRFLLWRYVVFVVDKSKECTRLRDFLTVMVHRKGVL